MAHLTHVSEMEKKIETLGRITTILKDVIQNKVNMLQSLLYVVSNGVNEIKREVDQVMEFYPRTFLF